MSRNYSISSDELTKSVKVANAKQDKRHESKRFSLQLALLVVALVIFIACVGGANWGLLYNYRENVSQESASHLMEINLQMGKLIEEKLNANWEVAGDVCTHLYDAENSANEQFYQYLRRKCETWGLSDIYVYFSDGACVDYDGITLNNGSASDIIYKAEKNGRDVSVVESTVMFTLPLTETTAFALNSHPAVAISVVADLDSLIDDMKLSSLGDSAFIFFAQNNGARISQLTNENYDTYNINTLFDQKDYVCLLHGEHSLTDENHFSDQCVFLTQFASNNNYIVATPVNTGSSLVWQLYYVVPDVVVNQTTNSFSTYAIALTIISLTVFVALSMMILVFFYRSRAKQFSKEMNMRDRLFNLLSENTDNAFALLSTDSETPLFVSSNTKKLTGSNFMYLQKEDNRFKMRYGDDFNSSAIGMINECLEKWDGKTEFRTDYIPYKTEDGKTRFYILHLYPVEGVDNEYIAVAQDVTEIRDREEKLNEALAMADAANSAKTHFLSNMSHDIRTPMNAIIKMTNFAIETVDNQQKQKKYLNVIKESSDHLLHLINDILDMSRIESGKTVIANESFDLCVLAENARDIIKPLAAAKKQHFVFDISSVRHKQLLGDQLKLSQVLLNLLNNAVKFTPEKGNVSFVLTELVSIRSETAAFRFEVKDSGIGISREDVSHIFEPFVRVDTEQNARVEGTGLGLSIVKNYVNAMGGSIKCESETGLGSNFIVELAFQRDLDVAKKPMQDVNADEGKDVFKGKRALLVEDNKINREIAVIMLERLGFAVDTAEDGKEGSEKYLNSEEGFYDIIYMDIQMPIMNGYDATAVIRKSNRKDADVPVVAMTANVFADDVEKSRAAGMDNHIGKPLVMSELVSESRKVL